MFEYEDTRLPKAEQAYAFIKKQLLSGQWGFGEELSVVEFSNALGFSRRPVLDALKRLEIEQFVEIIPQTGVFVRHYSEEDILDHFRAVLALEGMAAYLAAERRTEEDMRALREANLAMQQVIEGKFEKSDYFSMNQRFHRNVLLAAKSKKLMSLLVPQWDLNDFFLIQLDFFNTDFRSTIEEHEHIIHAIEQQQSGHARQEMEEHFHRFIQVVERSLLRLTGKP